MNILPYPYDGLQLNPLCWVFGHRLSFDRWIWDHRSTKTPPWVLARRINCSRLACGWHDLETVENYTPPSTHPVNSMPT